VIVVIVTILQRTADEDLFLEAPGDAVTLRCGRYLTGIPVR
jgi:hypothetical protein